MKKLRDIIVLIAVAAAFAFSLSMIRQAVSLGSPWFGVMIMLTFVGLSAFARPLFLLKMPGFWRRARACETKGAIYKALRVPAFGVLLRRTPLRSLNGDVYLEHHEEPSVVIAQLESAEAAHVIAAAILIPYMLYAVIKGWFGAFMGLTMLQIVFNLYPVMHLRWARIRLTRLHERARRKGMQ